MTGKETRCFSIRCLSPFQGCLQVIEACNAQACSQNGIDWRIQVRTPISQDQQTPLNKPKADHQVTLFGFWSLEGGFHRTPLPPLVCSHQIEYAAHPIIDVLLNLTLHVPFTQDDCYELWLLDKEELKPLALIASCRDPEQLPNIHNLEWPSNQLISHSMTHSKDTDNNLSQEACEILAHQINQRAGQPLRAQWFKRHSDNSGKGFGGIHIDSDIIQRILPSEAFPELLIRQDWLKDKEQNQVSDYIKWLAPYLLTLPTLKYDTRKYIEQLAFEQPGKVKNRHKLYPEVINQGRLQEILTEEEINQDKPGTGKNE